MLRNTAKRAAHEIAWMTDEIAELAAFLGTTGESAGNGGGSLHLDDVVERYRRASEAFAAGVGDGRRLRRRRAAPAAARPCWRDGSSRNKR